MHTSKLRILLQDFEVTRIGSSQPLEAPCEYKLLCIFEYLSPHVKHAWLYPDAFSTTPRHITRDRSERVATPTKQIVLLDRAELISANDSSMNESVGTG